MDGLARDNAGGSIEKGHLLGAFPLKEGVSVSSMAAGGDSRGTSTGAVMPHPHSPLCCGVFAPRARITGPTRVSHTLGAYLSVVVLEIAAGDSLIL